MKPASSKPGKAVGHLNWGQVRILYLREMRVALRERSIVINSILIPVFLYPFILWVAFTGLMFVMGQTEGFVSRVGLTGWPKGHPGLRLLLQRDDHLQLVDLRAAGRVGQTPAAAPSSSVAREQVLQGRLDAGLEFLAPRSNAAALPENFQARITFDQTSERSAAAQRRVRDDLEQYRRQWLKRLAQERGISAADWHGFTVASRNIASKRQMGTFILGMLAPALFVVMVAVGCFHPAVDATAGERERHTWETLMSTAANRLSIVTAKYLYVATLGSVAGLLNLLAIMVTLRPVFAPLLEKAGQHLGSTIPLSVLPVALLSAVLLAGFVAGGMMVFAAFARTFKEGQAMITPFYLVLILPVVFLQTPGLGLTLPLALVPVVNLTLMLREAVAGTYHWPQIAVTVLVSVLAITLCLRLATFILKFEDVVLGSYQGSLLKFARQKPWVVRKTAGSP
jgi:sodium transport system permease protein